MSAGHITNADSARRYRARMIAQGFRQIHIWVPDTRSSRFAEECRRQSLLLQGDAHEQETAEWLEAAGDREGWQ